LIEAVLERQLTMSPPAVARALTTRAIVAFLQSDFERAHADATVALEQLRDLGREADAAYCLGILGMIGVLSTGGASGEDDLRSAARTLESEGDHWGAVRMQNALNWALQLAGRPPPGSDEEYRAVLVAAEELGSPEDVSMARANLGRHRVLKGDVAVGLHELLDALEVATEIQHKGAIASILETVVEAAQGLGATEQAVRLLASAKALRRAIHVPPAPGQAERNERNEATLAGSLGREAFDRLSAEGSELSLDEALAEARALRSIAPPATAPARPLA
jgi:hypothetical protein